MKNVLITGGVGFIGINFVQYLLEKYPALHIFVIDKITYAAKPNLPFFHTLVRNEKRVSFLQANITTLHALTHLFEKNQFDVIFNFAAESHVDNSIESPIIFTISNVFGTHMLLELARQYKIPKFVQISTDEVYGSRDTGFFKETDRLTPSSPYSASKAAADMLCLAYYTTFNLPVIITRSVNNFGPFQHKEKLIPCFIKRLLQHERVPLYGTGKNVRDWIYVRDNCDAIDFITQNGTVGEIYNIAGHNEYTNFDITKKILKILNKDETAIQFVPDRLGHDWRYAINDDKLLSLGWSSKFLFDEALTTTVRWYEENG